MKDAFVLTNATIVAGDLAGTVVSEQAIVVDRTGLITQVCAMSSWTPLATLRRIDVAGYFVVPGLINAHAHLFSDGRPLHRVLTHGSAERAMSGVIRSSIGRRVLKRRARGNVLTQMLSGVTTLRSVGDVGYEVVEVRDDIERGAYLGPRVLPSGPLLAVSGGHGSPHIALICDSPSEAGRNTKINLQHRVSTIKVAATGGVTDATEVGEAGRPQMTEEQMSVICDEAHRAGVMVAAHAQSREGVVSALRAGVDTIEHGSGMTAEMVDLYRDNPRSLRGCSALIPTLQAAVALARIDRSRTRISDVGRSNALVVLDEMVQGIRDAVEHGVPIGMGTDSAVTFVTHYNTWRELDLLVRYGGLTPAHALHAATQGNATILGLAETTGTITVGRSADLVVLTRNPLDDFSAFVRPRAVIVRGEIIDYPQVRRFASIDNDLDTV